MLKVTEGMLWTLLQLTMDCNKNIFENVTEADFELLRGNYIDDQKACVNYPLTSPYSSVWAPRYAFRLLMSLLGPIIREVPVSTITWQPPLQPTTCPLMVTLQ